jgi:dolichyl-phosphate beta-glucosyltransferase
MYNVRRLASRTITMISKVLEEAGLPYYEVIAVDDGSSDGGHTFRAALESRVGPHGKLVVLRYEHNRGKGFALVTGFLHSSCPHVAFIDGDGDIDPRQLLYILAPLHLYDAVVTSKWHPQSRTRASLLRLVLSRGFRGLVWVLTGLKLRDTQTGAKAFRRDKLLRALKSMHSRRYVFDVELLAALKQVGARIVEVPSIAPLSLYGRQRPRVIAEMLLELLAVAYRQRRRSK